MVPGPVKYDHGKAAAHRTENTKSQDSMHRLFEWLCTEEELSKYKVLSVHVGTHLTSVSMDRNCPILAW